MFPYVCLATLPVFCDDDWPKRWIARCPGLLRKCLPNVTKITNVGDFPVKKRGKNSSFKLTLMGLYVVTQLALPWSHSVTQVCCKEIEYSLRVTHSIHVRITTTNTGLQQLDQRSLRLFLGHDGPRLGDDARRSHGQRQNHWTNQLP